MKLFLNNRIALLYKGNFEHTEELSNIIARFNGQLRIVEPEALDLSVAALAGYVDVPEPSLPYTKKNVLPSVSCLVFSNFTEEKLNRALDAIKAEGLELDFKAVITPHNRNWSFGALLVEMEREKAENDAMQQTQ